MPRRKNDVPLEPLRAVKIEKWEDDENYYEKVTYNRGGTNTNIHPKHPERPAEVVLQEAGEILLQAFYNAVAAGRIDLNKYTKHERVRE